MSRVKGWTDSSCISEDKVLSCDVYIEEIPEGAIRKEIAVKGDVENYAEGFVSFHMPPESIGKRYEVILIPVEDKP